MADTKVSKEGANQVSRGPFRVPAPPSVEVPHDNERIFEYENRILENHYKRGSRYYPFNIEPKRWERQRLAVPMTDEDRFLRRQWYEDQKMANCEVKDTRVKSYNIFRRIYRAPWDMIERAMANSFLGVVNARVLRICLPRAGMLLGGIVYVHYHMMYSSRDWESINGLYYYGSRQKRFPGDAPDAHPEDPKNFFMFNFYDRKALKD